MPATNKDIRDFMANMAEPMTAREIAEALECEQSHVRHIASKDKVALPSTYERIIALRKERDRLRDNAVRNPSRLRDKKRSRLT